jgi:hypothetical protein
LSNVNELVLSVVQTTDNQEPKFMRHEKKNEYNLYKTPVMVWSRFLTY